MLRDVHLADGGREGAGRRADALLPPRGRVGLAGDVLAILLDDLTGGLVHEPDRGPGGPPQHVVGDVPLRLRGQDVGEVLQVSRSVHDNTLVFLNLKYRL